jgi:mRNA interferase RelE/StbE
LSYRVILRRVAQNQLDNLSRNEYRLVAQAISALEKEPRPRKVKKLADSGLWRVRIGHYRIVYTINDREGVVIVVRVARRAEDTYKGL